MIKNCIRKLLSNPVLLIPPLFLLVATIIFSSLSFNLNYKIDTTASLLAWNSFFSLFMLFFISSVAAGMISLSLAALKKEARPSDFISGVRKYYLRNFMISIILVLSYIVVFYFSFYSSFFIGKLLSLETTIASIVFYLIYFCLISTILLSISLTPIVLVTKNFSILSSFRCSIHLVRKNYLFVLSLFAILFLFNKLISMIGSPILTEVITAIVIVPLYFLVLSDLVKNDI